MEGTVSYWRLFYHLVWSTKNRHPAIDKRRAESVERTIRAACHDEGALLHAIGFMPDHVHLAVSIPPRLAIAAFVRRLKSGSSLVLNREGATGDGAFAWQAEYGVLSFGERSLADVVAYVENQPARHTDRDLRLSFEQTERSQPETPSVRDDREPWKGCHREPGPLVPGSYRRIHPPGSTPTRGPLT
jgi:putative transposase